MGLLLQGSLPNLSVRAQLLAENELRFLRRWHSGPLGQHAPPGSDLRGRGPLLMAEEVGVLPGRPLRYRKVLAPQASPQVPLLRVPVVQLPVPLLRVRVVQLPVPLLRVRVVQLQVPLLRVRVVRLQVPLLRVPLVRLQVPLLRAPVVQLQVPLRVPVVRLPVPLRALQHRDLASLVLPA